MLSKCWPERVWGDLSESVKKGEFVIKIFLKTVFNEVLKSCKNDVC